MSSVQIVDGVPVYQASETYQGQKSKGDSLGKDAFLQLLVAQMQNQDPLEPTDNTQMITELAQFTTIEELQNLASTIKNTSAFDLVGKAVIMEVGKSTGATTTTTVGGYVDFVQMVDGKAMLSIGGYLYDYDDLDMVVDDAYLGYLWGQSSDADNNKDSEDTNKTPDDSNVTTDAPNTDSDIDSDGNTQNADGLEEEGV